MSEHINELFDKDGNLIGCLLSAEAWNHIKNDVSDKLGIQPTEPEPIISEPIHEWETLKEYWDFDYPVDMDVHCSECGSNTEDWSADEPRRFYLTSANLAGLVSFNCVQCKSKILKKHFKDEIVTECTPYQENKDLNKEARY